MSHQQPADVPYPELYAEFAAFWKDHRCVWAPEDPLRVYMLVFDHLYRKYMGWPLMSPELMLSVVYKTLGAREGKKPRGLFQTFDPRRYNGKLDIVDHFVNFFTYRLRQRLFRVYEGLMPKIDQKPLDECEEPWRKRVRQEETLRDAVNALDADQKAVIKERYWGNRSFVEIGRLLGQHPKRISRTHDAALARLREMIVAA